jgi:hypothetical protein
MKKIFITILIIALTALPAYGQTIGGWNGGGITSYTDVVSKWASGSCTGLLNSDGTCKAIGTNVQAELSLVKGTYTDTNLCTYTASGTVLNCNTATSTFQAANADLATLAAGGAASCLWGEKSDSSGIECKSSISITSITDAVKWVGQTTASKTVTFDLETNLDANDDVIIKIPDHGTDVTWTPAVVEYDNTFSAVQTFDATAGLKVGSTGVLITSDNDGLITLLGASGGYDEDMTINLDDTENTIVIGSNSGVTSINTGSIAFVTTGYIQGAIKIASDADGMDATATAAAGMYGTLFVATGAGTWILPAAAEGMNFCLLVTTSDDVIIDVDASDDITLVGVQDTDGDGVTNATGSSTGDFICMIAIDATHWYVMGKQGTWTAQ